MQMRVLENCILHTTIVLAAPMMKRFVRKNLGDCSSLTNQYTRRRSEVDSNANPLSSIQSRSKSHLSRHYHLCISQSETSRLKVILRILPLAIAIKLPQRAVSLPQPYARFWLWRILRPQPLCAMLPWSSWSSS
jgi:hypothetical protein